jgi:hypothetical protein
MRLTTSRRTIYYFSHVNDMWKESECNKDVCCITGCNHTHDPTTKPSCGLLHAQCYTTRYTHGLLLNFICFEICDVSCTWNLNTYNNSHSRNVKTIQNASILSPWTIGYKWFHHSSSRDLYPRSVYLSTSAPTSAIKSSAKLYMKENFVQRLFSLFIALLRPQCLNKGLSSRGSPMCFVWPATH